MKTIENNGITTEYKERKTLEIFKENQKNSKEDSSVLKHEISNLKDENHLLKHTIEEQEVKIKWYEEQFRINQAQKFGKSSEKSDSNQLSIFNEAEKESQKQSEEPDVQEIVYNRQKGKTKSRKTYEDLEVEEICYELLEEEQTCPECNNKLHEMKIEIRKELVVIPAQVKVVHHKRQVYACRACDNEGLGGTIITAPSPNPVLPGSLVGPSLLAYLMDNKYNKAIPLYRQEKDFINYGIDISRQNMASWIIEGSNRWLKPLYDIMHQILLKEPIIHADETPLNVLDEKDNKTNYMWLYASAEKGNHRILIYDYQNSRAQKHPKNFLEGFEGYLHTDGYSAYNRVPDIIQVGCMAHARRKFDETLKAAPKNIDISNSKAKEALDIIGELYKLEKEYKTKKLTPEEIYIQRQEKTKPILEEYKKWLDKEIKRTLPKSKLGQALKYSINQWPKLTRFIDDGKLDIDNNLAERAIKPFVIGRKNWLFSKSPKGATASGVIYSILETAKANKVKPFHYLTYLFEKLPNIDLKDRSQLDALLPWAKEFPEELKLKTESSES